jgi:hypothetical protein
LDTSYENKGLAKTNKSGCTDLGTFSLREGAIKARKREIFRRV